MKIINCTPHSITILNSENEIIASFPKGEVVPRLSQFTQNVDSVNGIPITETQFGDTTDLPEAKEGVLLIVSRLVMSANSHRNDLLVPNGIVRDEEGNIIGSSSLARN